MSDSQPTFLFQALVTIFGLVAIVGFVAWWARRDRKEFNVLRVLAIAFATLLGSRPFVAAFWWLIPHDTNTHNPYLLAAWCVPIFALEVWGIILSRHAIRRWRQKHEPPSA